MVNKIFLVLTAALCSSLGFAHGQHKMGSNSFSNKPRNASSPPHIVMSYPGHPREAMSTLDTRPGYLTRALQGERNFGELNTGDIDVEEDAWGEDSTKYRSAAPRHARAR